MAEKRQFLRIAKNLCATFVALFAFVIAPAFADDLCKNLFDINNVVVGELSNANGNINPNITDYVTFNYIEVNPGENYTLSLTTEHSGNAGRILVFYDINKNYISGSVFLITTGPGAKSGTFTVPNGAKYVRFSPMRYDDTDVQLERGSTATAYQPYNPLCATCQGIVKNYESAVGTVAQNGTPTPTNPIEPTFYTQGDMVLRKVGDVADSYDAATGKITRRVGVKVLDGTEDWTPIDVENTLLYKLSISGKANGASLSNYFSGVYKHRGQLADFELGMYNLSSEVSSFVFRYDAIDTLAKWTNYLADQYANGTPVTVWYPLATPVEETWTGGTSYCADAIKIATTAYNAAAFAPVEAALESAVTTIKDVVANTIVQADAIQNLQDTKQTMPDASGTNGTCPQYRQCLLVESEDGTPQWFPIIDPFKDFITPILANNSTIPAVDAQRRFAGDLDLCRMLPQTDAESQANNNIAKCTSVSNYNNTAEANTVRGTALKQTEWGYEFKAADLADNPNNDSGIVYGISKCVSTDIPSPGYAKPATSTQLNNALWDARPTTMAEADKYRNCWCKTTGIAYGGQYYETSAAPWVFAYTAGSAAACADNCARNCANYVRSYAAFLSAMMNWAVE